MSDFTPVVLIGHAGLDLWHCAWNIIRKVLVARFSNIDAIFYAHATDLRLILSDLITVQITQIELVEVLRHLAIEKEIAEVAARLDRDHVASLDNASSSNVAETW